jgi:hypothetical protein
MDMNPESFLDSEDWDDDSLMQQVDMKQLTTAAKHLNELREEYERKEQEAEEAKKRYASFKHETMPQMMAMAGVSAVTDDQGREYKLVTKYHCSPNKNEDDKLLMRHWLQNYGGDHLVKRQAIVDGHLIEKLLQWNIPHKEETNVNTMSLKAWLIDQIGGKGGQVRIQPEEIPKIFHFIGLPEVEIKE